MTENTLALHIVTTWASFSHSQLQESHVAYPFVFIDTPAKLNQCRERLRGCGNLVLGPSTEDRVHELEVVAEAGVQIVQGSMTHDLNLKNKGLTESFNTFVVRSARETDWLACRCLNQKGSHLGGDLGHDPH